jgi:predicted component of type VI protein secretion system
MPAHLVALNDGPSILVDKPILLIGRHPECDIQIDSRKISRRHCCIAQVNDYLVVRDLDSTNGIRINGVRVIEGKLRTGDELTVGNHRYQVSWQDGRGPAVVGSARAKAPPPVSPVPHSIPVPGPALADEDDLLEACDEPVPLPDPGRPGPSVPLPRSSKDDPVVIPDNLELVPNSGSYPDLAGPAPRPQGQ